MRVLHKVVSRNLEVNPIETRKVSRRGVLLGRQGDTLVALVVTRIDRLARSIADLQVIVATLKAKGAALRTTDGMAFDTSTAMGKCFLDMLGTFAEFETNLRRERQLEGIAKAKAAGVYQGRKPTIDADAVRKLKSDGLERARSPSG